MNTIWKYPLINSEEAFEMPKGAQTLSAQAQDGGIYIWVLVDPNEQKLMKKRFEIFGTGRAITGDLTARRFIDTVQLNEFVFHVFEITI